MFSNDIVESDAFLEMPATSQNLYFHLGMRCDDDGFVNPATTMRMIGANKNDLDVLISKKFLLAFKNGVVVIKHHRINNNWDSRDSRRTVYTEELKMLFVKENRSYTFEEHQGVAVDKIYSKDKVYSLPDGNPTGSRRQNRIDKNRIDKNTKVSKQVKLSEGYEISFQEFWNIYPEKVAKGKAYDVWKLLDQETKAICIKAIKNQVANKHFYKAWKKEDVPPHPTTWLNQRRWEDEVKEVKKEEIIKLVSK